MNNLPNRTPITPPRDPIIKKDTENIKMKPRYQNPAKTPEILAAKELNKITCERCSVTNSKNVIIAELRTKSRASSPQKRAQIIPAKKNGKKMVST